MTHKKKSFRSAAPVWAAFAVPIVWLAVLMAGRYETGMTVFDLAAQFSEAMKTPFALRWTPHTAKFIGIFLLLYGGAILFYYTGQKNTRPGEEHGSASWGSVRELDKKYRDKDASQNVILTQHFQMSMNGKLHRRNLLQIVVGGSGSGKTRFFVKPNLMQCVSEKYPCSFVVTDPKGSLIVECGRMLRHFGYRIKVMNTINFAKSMHYNPLAYIRSEKDILKLVNCLIANTRGEGKGGDPFWDKSEVLLYTALIGYLWQEALEEDRNFATLIDMIGSMQTREDNEDFQNPIDLMFEDLEREKPDCFAVRQYKKFKLAAGKTAKSILISCGARLAPFDIKELRDLMEYDELELDTLGEEKTALFVIISDTDATFNFVVSIMYSQLFNLLCDKADDVYNGRLPVHVRMLLDEFANIGQIPQFEKLIATIRSREISASIILQSKSQLKAIYRDNADTIEGNCDTTLFLGGKEKTTLKELAEVLGKETIDLYNTSDTRGTSQSYGLNYQKTGKELMSQDEIAVMDGGKCIMQLRGVRPFFSDKFDITKHKRYKELSDYDKKNTFDMEQYVKHLHHMKVTEKTKVDEAFDCGELSPDTTE